MASMWNAPNSMQGWFLMKHFDRTECSGDSLRIGLLLRRWSVMLTQYQMTSDFLL